MPFFVGGHRKCGDEDTFFQQRGGIMLRYHRPQITKQDASRTLKTLGLKNSRDKLLRAHLHHIRIWFNKNPLSATNVEREMTAVLYYFDTKDKDTEFFGKDCVFQGLQEDNIGVHYFVWKYRGNDKKIKIGIDEFYSDVVKNHYKKSLRAYLKHKWNLKRDRIGNVDSIVSSVGTPSSPPSTIVESDDDSDDSVEV